MKTIIVRYVAAMACFTAGMIFYASGEHIIGMLLYTAAAFANVGRIKPEPFWNGSRIQWFLLFAIPLSAIAVIWLTANGYIFQPSSAPHAAPEPPSPVQAVGLWVLMLAVMIGRYYWETRTLRTGSARPVVS